MNTNSMQIVHFSMHDNVGGSGRAAYRIHCGLKSLDLRSHMLVRHKGTSDPDVDTVHGGGLGKAKDRIAEEITSRTGFQDCLIPSSRRVLSHSWVKHANVFQMYNLHGGYFSLSLLPPMSKKGVVVWRLSDMWPATGHCAYSGECEKWASGCGECPDLATYPPIATDRTAFLWRRKQRIYQKTELTLVAPSSWTERIARASPLLAHFPVRRIPNGIDLSVFRPYEKAAMRAFLDIDPDVRIVLFVAHSIGTDKRKGINYLIDSLRLLSTNDKILLALVGLDADKVVIGQNIPTRQFGYVAEDKLLAAIYSAADVLVAPSTSENLANSVLEAMACALPVVAFDAGGTRDAVRHLETGLLAPPEDAPALADHLKRLLEEPDLRSTLGRRAREVMEKEFSSELQAFRFAELYQELLEAKRCRIAPRSRT